jgi:hypothetical protein
MALVKPEFAPEFAVLTAWVSALLPWSVSVAYEQVLGGTLLQVHFPAVLVRFLFEVDVPGPNPLVLSPWESIGYYSAAPGPVPFAAYTVGSALVGAAVVVSVLLYVYDDAETVPVDPVRAIGGLVGAAAVVYAVTALTLQFGVPYVDSVPATPLTGVVVPVGVLFQLVFAYALLTVDRGEVAA